MIRLLLPLLLAFFFQTASAAELCEVHRVIDGDTVHLVPLEVDGTDSGRALLKLRLLDIEAEELRSGTSRAFDAAAWLAHACEDSPWLAYELDAVRPRDKYGRGLGRLWLREGEAWFEVAPAMLALGLVDPYIDHGGDDGEALE